MRPQDIFTWSAARTAWPRQPSRSPCPLCPSPSRAVLSSILTYPSCIHGNGHDMSACKQTRHFHLLCFHSTSAHADTGSCLVLLLLASSPLPPPPSPQVHNIPMRGDGRADFTGPWAAASLSFLHAVVSELRHTRTHQFTHQNIRQVCLASGFPEVKWLGPRANGLEPRSGLTPSVVALSHSAFPPAPQGRACFPAQASPWAVPSCFWSAAYLISEWDVGSW